MSLKYLCFYLNKSDQLKRNGLLLRNIKILLVQLSSVIKKLCIYWLFVSYVMAESLHALPSIYYWVKCASGITDVNFSEILTCGFKFSYSFRDSASSQSIIANKNTGLV